MTQAARGLDAHRALRRGRGAWAMLALVAVVVPAASGQPALPSMAEQEHVTLWDQGLVVQWAVVGRQYAEDDLPHVAWTTAGEPRVSLAELVGVVSPGASATSGGALPVSTYVYAATLPVAPGQSISYRAGSEGTGMTPERTVTRPAQDRLHFAALGDIGVDSTAPDGSCMSPTQPEQCFAHVIRDRIIAADPDMVLIPGDLAYSNSRLGWDSFMRFMTPLQSTVPVMAVAGNHEYHASLGYEQFLAEYVLPGDEHRFTFKAGPVTFVGINSDHICGPHKPPTGPPQDVCAGGHLLPEYTEWVRQALEDASQDETPWTIFFMHHPPYSYGRHGDHEGLQWLYQEWIERYGVDVVLTSHDHLYSRSHPMLGGDATRNGTSYSQGDGVVYLVTGGGGRGLYEQAGPRPAWLAAGQSVHHYVEFRVSPDRLEVEATRIDGTQLDRFTIDISQEQAPTASPRATPLPVWVLVALLLFVRRR